MKTKPSSKDLNYLIYKAWCDKTTFDDIFSETNLKEKEVMRIMKRFLRKKSYVLWRKRVKKINSNKRLNKD